MPVNSVVNTPQNTTYFTQFTCTGKGFKIVDSTTNLQDISNIDFSQFEATEPDELGNIGVGSSYFFESSQYKLNPCKTVLNKNSLYNKPLAKSAIIERPAHSTNYRQKSSFVHKTGVPSFSRFYRELKSLKKVDPKMRSKLSFT